MFYKIPLCCSAYPQGPGSSQQAGKAAALSQSAYRWELRKTRKNRLVMHMAGQRVRRWGKYLLLRYRSPFVRALWYWSTSTSTSTSYVVNPREEGVFHACMNPTDVLGSQNDSPLNLMFQSSSALRAPSFPSSGGMDPVQTARPKRFDIFSETSGLSEFQPRFELCRPTHPRVGYCYMSRTLNGGSFLSSHQ